jgi:hypothetical protein
MVRQMISDSSMRACILVLLARALTDLDILTRAGLLLSPLSLGGQFLFGLLRLVDAAGATP